MHFLDFDKTVVNTCLDYKIASQGLQMCSTNYQKKSMTLHNNKNLHFPTIIYNFHSNQNLI